MALAKWIAASGDENALIFLLLNQSDINRKTHKREELLSHFNLCGRPICAREHFASSQVFTCNYQVAKNFIFI